MLHCDEWDRVVALPRHKSVTGATLLQCTQFHNRGKTQWTISFILQSSHIMILNSTMFGGNRTKDVEVGPDRRTDRQADSYIPRKLCLRGGLLIKVTVGTTQCLLDIAGPARAKPHTKAPENYK